MIRKGIILAGGSATRLYPLTSVISKQIMPIYDKPMIYYPLFVLMEANVKNILIISTPRDIHMFKCLLGDGSQWGIHFEYEIQEKPNGLAEAFIIGEKFIGKDNVVMILGDNIFYGNNLYKSLKNADKNKLEATIFGYYVQDPTAYGVIEIDKDNKAISIEEKPKIPKSNYAVPGLYFYPNDVVEIAKTIKPSARGELEITAINDEYLKSNRLNVEILGRGTAWFDMGTCDSLIETASFVQTIEKRQGLQICSPDEIAFRKGWIDNNQLSKIAEKFMNTDYGKYLKYIAENEKGGFNGKI